MTEGDIHTVPREGRWANEREGDAGDISTHDTKEEAVEAGRDVARKGKVEHLIHRQDGTIGERNSYGGDPASSPG